MTLPHVKLNPGREQSLLRRHPWVFSRAIKSVPPSLQDGDLVQVQDHRGRILGTGHYQNSSLSIRMLSFDDQPIDQSYWDRRLQEAADYRTNLRFLKPQVTNTFRLVHGEGDQLPGLVIDIYDRVAVLQAHSIGMYKSRNEIANAILKINDLTIDAVYCKSKEALPSEFAQTISDEWIHGTPPGEINVLENGVRFTIDVESGQKTGFFLDQRDNRQYLSHYTQSTSVLNCFCYTGGFSLYALHHGATQVVSVDTSAKALEILEKNLLLNSFEGTHQSVRENVLTYLTQTDDRFDIVIVDPPAFAKTLNKRHNAVQAYKRLNMMAMSRIKKGGMLFTFSCSQVVDTQLFYDTIVAAAIEAGRPARVAQQLSQGADHPISIYHPEGHYLKGLILMMD